MIIGHCLIRTYRKFKNQGLGTRFVIVGIPLVPVQSYYILKDTNQSIEVDLYWKQAVKVYTIMVSVFYLFIKYITGQQHYDDISFQNLFLIVLAINVLVYFLFDVYTLKDRKIRKLLSRSVYINALPKFLGQTVAFDVQKGFISNFQSKFGISWKELVKNNTFEDKHLPYLFPIVLYELYLYKNKRTRKYFNKIFSRYKEIEHLR